MNGTLHAVAITAALQVVKAMVFITAVGVAELQVGMAIASSH